MSSTLEHEIMEKFRQLRPAARQHVRALIEQEAASEVEQVDLLAFDYDAWFRDVETLRQEIRAGQVDKLPPVDVVEILHDIREGEDE
jgi:hypothetical protein